MPIAFWCILVAIVIAYVPVALAKRSKASGYDNANPRTTEAAFTGFNARAYGAHQNGMEAFPFFAVAVIVGHYLGGDTDTLDRLAMAWVAVRLVYIALYLKGIAPLRTVVWLGAFLIAIAIFTLPAWG
jgi:uncharacterized MAPEG superfamily protein